MLMQVPKQEPSKQKLNPPLLLINFKTYPQATGETAIKLAEIVEDVANEYPTLTFAVAPQFTDLWRVAQVVDKTWVFAQHIDPITPGAHTGHILPEAVKIAGARGTLINHSERKVPIEVIEKAIARAREVGLTTVVCAGSPEESEKVAKFVPDFVAYEPPELIGTGISVSRAKPEVLKVAVEKIISASGGKTIPLCGAGIVTGEDVYKALVLGAKGILVASGVVKAKDPAKVLVDFAEASMKYLEEQ